VSKQWQGKKIGWAIMMRDIIFHADKDKMRLFLIPDGNVKGFYTKLGFRPSEKATPMIDEKTPVESVLYVREPILYPQRSSVKPG
jgi:hypothetical protein